MTTAVHSHDADITTFVPAVAVLGQPKNPTFGALNLRWRCWKRRFL
jgi:hypothetical protein